MNSNKKYKFSGGFKWIVSFLFVCFSAKAFAVEEPYVNELKGGQVAVNNSFTVADEKFGSSLTWTLTRPVDNIVSFEINFDTAVYFYNTPFNCSVNVKIYIYGNPNNINEITDSVQHANIPLDLRYDTVTGKPYKGIAMYKFTGAYKFGVKILSISSPQLNPIPAIFRLKGQIIVNRKYNFGDNSSDVTRFSVLNGNQLKLEWTPSLYPGAEMFDLEYTHIDRNSQIAATIMNSPSGSNYSVPVDSLAKWLKNNSTRITTAAASYLINVPYDSGFILFRIRGVQIHYPDDLRWEGNWNYTARPVNLSCGGSVDDCPSGIVKFDGHEQNLNWQFSISFAEEGKRKEVVSYFGGDLRNRQSVTINNSDNKSVVAETIYDALGRPAASILPAPTNDSTIHYFRGFNKNKNGNPYSFSDLLYGVNCVTTADSLSYTSGTGRYYSSSNPFLNTYQYSKYIPNAGGYPLAVTEYMADNTGRIKAQGGVGPAFQLGQNHDTKYFYGKPTQTELDRLFGSEAGNASHYLKNMVQDANGQISVSYQDASGKTIATALAGAAPSNVHSLPSNGAGASVQVSNDLIQPGDFVHNPGDYSLTASATFLAPVTGSYSFNYRVDPLVYQKLYGPNKDSIICSDCHYDLEITVKDDCNNLIDRDTIAAGNVFDTSCASMPDTLQGIMNVTLAKIGEYYITYTLRISEDALNFYDSVHLVKNSDIKKLNYFLLEELKETDFYGCYSNCATCFDKLGTRPEFVATFKSLYVADSVAFGIADSLWVLTLYDSLYANCQSIQSQCAVNICDEKLALLKMDVSPGGQYALYDNTYHLLELPINRLAMRNQISFFTNELGVRDSIVIYNAEGDDSLKVDVKDLNDSLFIKNWKDVWADSLVRLHPEYCYYLWCIANSNSYEFDRKVEDLTDADSAAVNGWFNPNIYYKLLDADPFFSGVLNLPRYNKMKKSLLQFSRRYVRNSQPNKNILQFVDIILYCKTQYNGWTSCNPDSACRSRNREWFMYKTLYLNLKQKFYEEARRTSSNPVFANCKNCSIGGDLGGLGDTLINGCTDTCFNNAFQKTYGGNGDDYAYDVQALESGGVIVAGKTNSFGSTFDGYILRLNNRGDVLWSKTFAVNTYDADEQFNKIRQTTDGGYIAVGTSKVSTATTSEIIAIKLNKNGNIIWSKQFGLGSTGGEIGRDICETSDGGFVICAATNFGSSRVILTKLNSSGNVLWSKKYESNANAEATNILASGDTVIVSGHYYTGNYFDGFLMKVNHLSGNATWVKGYDIAGLNNYVSGIENKDGQYYFQSYSTPTISNLNNPVNTVLSTDVNGTIQLRRDITTPTYRALASYPDGYGNVIITQHDATNTNNSLDNLFYFKMNSTGTFLSKFAIHTQNTAVAVTKASPAPGNTTVLAGYTNPYPTSVDHNIFILKTSADTAHFACSKDTTTASSSQPNVTTTSLGWAESNISFTFNSSLLFSANATTFVNNLCSYSPCPVVSCDTSNWIPFNDSTCNYHCPGGIYNPYDKDSVLYYVEYGNPNTSPSGTPPGYGNCQFYPAFDLYTGLASSCRFFNVWVCEYDSTCGGVCPPDTSYSSSCPASGTDTLYKNKERRYPEYVNPDKLFSTVSSGNPQQGSGQQQQVIIDECKNSCEAQADYWIRTLQRCGISPADSITLRAALIDICSKGCSIGSPFGTSSIPLSIPATYHSFEEAIDAILPGSINDSCTAELFAMPYPHDKQPVLTERVITETDYPICQRLGQFRSAYITSGYPGTLHQYMQSTFGSSCTLDSTELYDLVNACLNCNGILKNDIVLPVLFDPQSKPCLKCDSVNVALSAFNTKFPGIPVTDDDYEILFTNFFNHRFGFALTYEQYRNFLDSCAAHPGYTGQLCNLPVTEEVQGDDNSCIRELFVTALTNATNTYIAYIDSVRRDFREAWLTKCMNVQPKLTMTASLYEYHYTLYYYDQSGNLVKTVPPEGVALFSPAEIQLVQQKRSAGNNSYCTNNNAMAFGASGGAIIFQNGPAAPHLNTGNQPFTIECWLKLGTFNNQGVLSNNWTFADGQGGYAEKGYAVNIKNGRLVLLMGEGISGTSGIVEVQSLPLTGIISPNTWNHFACERINTGNGVKIYINGNEIPVSYLKNNFVTGNIDNNVSAGFYTGASYTGGVVQNLSSGAIKHLRIYKRAVPQTELRQNYFDYCGNPANNEAIVFWETFNEGIWATGPVPGLTYVYDRIYNVPGYAGGSSQNFELGSGSMVPPHRLVTTYQYNSLNQVLQQYSPDGDTSAFFYDRLGRLTVSQNKEQKDVASYSGSINRFSYTKYDALGRIKEVGEKSGAVDIRTINLLDDAALNNWINNTGYPAATDKQLTKTIYDTPINLYQSTTTSRKRVVASIYIENANDTQGDSTLYAYDILGNVKTLVQHVKALVAADATNGKKQIDYEYDLVSGKVNMVSYQPGKGDQFFYKYLYDADNRVTRSLSSRDKLVWIEDASYNYYLHGPLARMELGQNKVQGTDYAYTLQGWLKGINSNALSPQYEMGQDGWAGTTFARVSRDVYSYSLGYYSQDYTAIGGSSAAAMTQAVYQHPGNTDNTGRQLFNGNISNTIVALSKIDNGAAKGYSYGYDQLNRLVYMNQHTISGATWSNTNIIAAYAESIAYDANGNILKYQRKGANGAAGPLDMDSLNYKYNRDISGNLVNNRLNHVRDQVSSSNYTVDIDNQANNNYSYDKIGNLKTDAAETISNINWTVYGKIRSVTKTTTTIDYDYDPGGNRTYKKVTGIIADNNTSTWYIRDAQGNTLAVYSKTGDGDIKWDEQHLYGSSRLGMWQWDTIVPAAPPVVGSNGTPVYDSLLCGSRTYELSNHLGNVLTTISDKKIGHDNGGGVVDYYFAEVLSANDYYPGGMIQPGRTYSTENGYRYSINGQEKTPEIAPNTTTAEFWQYDARIGRRWNVDPIIKIWESPYATFSNNPIYYADPLGLDSEGRPDRGANKRAGRYAKKHGIEKYRIADMKNGAGVTLNYMNDEGHMVSRKFLKRKHNPEQDFTSNPLTTYNSDAGSNYHTEGKTTVKSLLTDWFYNWNSDRMRNTIIVDGPLHDEVKNMENVQRLFRQGINALYNSNTKGFTAGTSFTSFDPMSDLNGQDGTKMKRQLLLDILAGKPIKDYVVFNAEFILGSFGFSMRVTNDGKHMVMTVYDSKTVLSATDGGKKLLKQVIPENLSSTFQRYIYVMPIGDVINEYKNSIINSYKNR